MSVTTTSADTNSGMAAELLRDIQQRNYGAAETKARQLWNQLSREAQAMHKARDMIKATLDEIERKIHRQRVAAARLGAIRLAEPKQEEPDIFLQEMDSRIQHLDQAQKMQHSELGQGMRTGFMYARAIYEGIQK